MRTQTNSPSSGEASALGSGGAPGEVRASFALWLAAIAAALFETVLVVIEVLSGHSALSAGSVVVGVGTRLLVFGAVVYVASQMLRGRNWARVTLALGLGVIGALSIVIGPVSWLAAGHSVGEFLVGANLMGILFASSRVVHLIAVFAALILMFRPAANDYFQASRTARRQTRAQT